jgi:GGDEF domain-containing protein
VALADISAGSGTQFDPEIAELLIDEIGSGTPLSPSMAVAVASALDTAGLPDGHEHEPGSDPLTLLPGHRAFHEAARRLAGGGAEADHGTLTVAIVQLEDLDALNRREGYIAGDRAITLAARAAQLAAARFGGTVYRDSGRRFGILVVAAPGAAQPDLAAELHTEFAIGPRVRIAVITGAPDETGEDVIARARAAVASPALPGDVK